MLTKTLKLEYIGWSSDQSLKAIAEAENILFGKSKDGFKSSGPWVARIKGTHPVFKLDREFLPGHLDFSEANSVGSRGVYKYFHLEEGGVFEVYERLSWRRDARYFCTVTDGKIVELDRSEVKEYAEHKDEDMEEE